MQNLEDTKIKNEQKLMKLCHFEDKFLMSHSFGVGL